MNRFAPLLAVVALTGCATTRVYRLAADPSQAASMRAPLVSVAQGMGYQAADLTPTVVTVPLDDVSRINFEVQGDQYNMLVLVDDKKVAADKLEATIAAAHAKGDEIWQAALAARTANAPPPR